MTRRSFCTYFDVNYLGRGLALLESLRSTTPDFSLHVLCLDDATADHLAGRALPEVRLTRLVELEAADPDLLATKGTRSRVEYFFTAGPAFMRYLLDLDSSLSLLTYLDSDLYFFASPEPLFDEALAADAATVIVGHRFPARLKHLEETGRYNVAWVSFRRDTDGLASLDYWRAACIDWCYDRVERDRYADQKYLEEFPNRFPRVHELQHLGADAAPWNLSSASISQRDGRFFAGGQPLIFFHFQGLKSPFPGVIDLHLEPYGERATPPLRRMYQQYLARLRDHAGINLRTSRAPELPLLTLAGHTTRGLLRRTSALYIGGRLL